MGWHIRCPQLVYKAAIQRFTMQGRADKADEVFAEARKLTHHGERQIFWEHKEQIPTVFVQNLDTEAFFDCSQFPGVVKFFSDHHEALRDSLETLGKLAAPSYPYLKPEGTWEYIFLFHRGEWVEETCEVMPSFCAGAKK